MITISHLYKSFNNQVVISDLNLEINEGIITALVGKNGAGKTTLIRLITGLLKPDSGKIDLKNNNIGVFLGGDVNLYRNLSALETIYYFGALHGVDKDIIDHRLDYLDDFLDFKSFLYKKVYSLSRGMAQKIGLALSVIHNPDFLFLDEPSTGLDIETSNDIVQFIDYLKSQNKTVFIATHNIFEISDLSDQIAFLNGGKIIDTVSTSEFFYGCPSDKKSKLIIDRISK